MAIISEPRKQLVGGGALMKYVLGEGRHTKAFHLAMQLTTSLLLLRLHGNASGWQEHI
jgi:hypothetical protein